MGGAHTRRVGYSRAEYISDAVIHVSGLVSVMLAVPVLITLTVMVRGDAPAIIGTAIYGVTLITMILCSALYHMVTHHHWRPLLKKLDHSAIYCKIAGTYTPFTLLASGHGGWLLGGIWGLALAGMGLRVLAPGRYRGLAITLYLVMGWIGLFAGDALFGGMTMPVFMLILAGGVLYTIGVIFFLIERLPFHNTIWHGFVLVASMMFYAAVTVHVIGGSVA